MKISDKISYIYYQIRIKLICIVLLCCSNFYSQNKQSGSVEQSRVIDSLQLIIKNAKHDTTAITALYQWAFAISQGQPDEAIKILNKAQTLAEKDFAFDPSTDLKPNALQTIYLKKLARIFKLMGVSYYYKSDNEKALSYYSKSLEVNKAINDKTGIAAGYYNMGHANFQLGKMKEALDFFNRSIKINEEINDKFNVAGAYNNISNIYMVQGQIKEALDYSGRSLKIYEALDNKKGVASILNTMANLFREQGQIKEALEFSTRCLKILEEVNDKRGLAGALANISIMYRAQGQLKEALDFSQRSLKISEDINDKKSMVNALFSIGNIYSSMANKTSALDYYQRSLKISEEVKFNEGISFSSSGISVVYLDLGNLEEALNYGVKGLQLSKELGYPDLIKDAANNLKVIYQKQNNTKKALEMFELYIVMRDSISNEQNRKAGYKSHLQYEYGRKALADSIRSLQEKRISSSKLAESQAKFKQEKTQKIALYVIAGILLFLAGVLFYNYRRKNRSNQQLSFQKQQIENKNSQLEDQKKSIVNQNLLLENKNQLITDSIEYARKIQDSMLPDAGTLVKHFSEAFILYQPKDIVSGDFYWLQESSSGIVLAVSDCTGHGVPGALMSVLGHNSLDAAYGQLLDLSPANVLRYVDTYMKQKTRNQDSTSGNVDGMAISLIDYNRETKKIIYSTANHYLYIVGKNGAKEIKDNAFSIGSWQSQNIIQGEIQLQKDDMIYLFSDGYADQKGGVEKKKFMHSRLKELFIEIAKLPAEEQKEVLKTEMDKWKGSNPQIDDILVVGVKI